MDTRDSEFVSFVGKFRQLWAAGRAAQLSADCQAGMATVALRVQLGRAPAPAHRHHGQPQPGRRSRTKGAAHQRRKARREAERVAEEAARTERVAGEVAEAGKIAEKAAEDGSRRTTEKVAEDEGMIAEKAAEAEQITEEVDTEAERKRITKEAGNAERRIAEEAANAAARIIDTVIAVGAGVAAVARRVADNAAAKKKADEDNEDDRDDDSVNEFIATCISSDEEDNDDRYQGGLFEATKNMIERETDEVIEIIHDFHSEWKRTGNGRLVKASLTQVVNERMTKSVFGASPSTPSQKRKLRNAVRKRAREAISSDSSPTLPCSKIRK